MGDQRLGTADSVFTLRRDNLLQEQSHLSMASSDEFGTSFNNKAPWRDAGHGSHGKGKGKGKGRGKHSNHNGDWSRNPSPQASHSSDQEDHEPFKACPRTFEDHLVILFYTNMYLDFGVLASTPQLPRSHVGLPDFVAPLPSKGPKFIIGRLKPSKLQHVRDAVTPLKRQILCAKCLDESGMH